MSNHAELYDKVVEACELSSVLAPGIVRRALSDGGSTPDTATAADYRAALPRILARLRAYLSEAELHHRQRKLETLLHVAHATPTEIKIAGTTTSPGFSLPVDEDATLVGRRYTQDELRRALEENKKKD
jgi:hypothetical protein